MGRAYTYNHAGVLCEHMPAGSRLLAAFDPKAAWTETAWMLRSIEFACRAMVWQKTEDGAKGINKPKPVPVPGRKPRNASDIAKGAAAVASNLGLEGMV